MLRRLGFFRELGHGDADGPSLSEARRTAPAADQGEIARYLESAPTLVATGQVANDVLDARNHDIAPLELATDGQWMWPRDLAFYVRHYNVALPDEFLADIRARAWRPPNLTDAELARIAEEVTGGPVGA